MYVEVIEPKSITLAIFIVLSGCAGAPFLHNNQVIKQDVSKIIFQLNSTDKETFINMKKAVLKDGYTILTQDQDTNSFSTDFKSAAKSGSDLATDVQLKVSINDKKSNYYW